MMLHCLASLMQGAEEVHWRVEGHASQQGFTGGTGGLAVSVQLR